MRIAHFIHRYPPALGGSEAYFARLSAHLAAAGHEVHVFTTTALDLEAFWNRDARQLRAGTTVQDGVTVHRLPLWHIPLGHRWILKLLSLVPVPSWQAFAMHFNPIVPAMLRTAGKFDLVHAGVFPYSFPLMSGWRLARRRRVPFFLTPFVHTGDPSDPRDPVRRAYTTPALLRIAAAADRVFVQTEGERRVLAAQGIGGLVMQGLGVDTASCQGGDRGRARQAWSAGNEVVVGHLANHSREKGTIALCLAMQRAWERGSTARLVLAGPGMPAYRVFRAGFVPRGPMIELGVLDEQGKRDFFAGLDVFALPSISDSFGLVLLEAWANGVPVAVYNAGGPPWIVRDGEDGLVVPSGDVEGLSRALVRLADNEWLRRRMGEAGRSRLGEFDWRSRLDVVRRECEECI